LISISRLLIHQFRSVLHRVGIRPTVVTPVHFIADRSGLRIRSQNVDAAVEYLQEGSLPAEQFAAPQALLDDCEGRKDEPVRLETQKDGKIVAQWRDGGIPQLTQYDPEDPASRPFPELPATLTENPAKLFRALDDAVHVTCTDITRYNLNCVQLDGQSGTIAATDGHELLWQTGFKFPWEDEPLVQANRVFSSSVLPNDQAVRVGEIAGRVVFDCGPWTIWLTTFVDGKFPKLTEILERAAVPVCRCTFTANDLRYLSQTLRHLPVAEDEHAPITIELNEHPKFRARGTGHPEPTEIVLVGTPVEGAPISVACNRRYLERAVELGLPELHLNGNDKQLRAFDERRTYIWMPLEEGAVIPPSANAIRIEPKPDEPTTESSSPNHRRKSVPKAQTTQPETASISADSVVKSAVPALAAAETAPRIKRTRESRPAATTSPIEQTKALLTFQREQIVKTKELLAALRRQQKQSKVVSATLAQLKELQKIA
jgi:hypothetical protein